MEGEETKEQNATGRKPKLITWYTGWGAGGGGAAAAFNGAASRTNTNPIKTSNVVGSRRCDELKQLNAS